MIALPQPWDRLLTEGGLIRVGEVAVVVEIDEPVSLVDCHLVEGFGDQDGGSATGVFTTTLPFPVRLRLDRLP